jgi:pilus assembly protein CpaC
MRISRCGVASVALLSAMASAQTLHYRPPAVDQTRLPAAVPSAVAAVQPPAPATTVASADTPQPLRTLHALAASTAFKKSVPTPRANIAALPPAPPAARGVENLHIIVGQSAILRGTMMKRIYVANPTVLQTFNSAPDELVVTAKSPGATSLIIWDTAGNTQMYNVAADFDPMSLRAALDSELPGNHIEVHGGQDLLTLTGTVSTKEMADQAGKLAGAYAKNVANSLRVVSPRDKQVELKLQILEVDRSKMEQFGINLFRPTGSNLGGLSTQQFPTTATATPDPASGLETVAISNPLSFFFYNVKNNVGVTLQDLEQKDVVQILAEPTLTTMSGEAAKFLSGGEFPFPVVQGGTGNSTAITIQFRPYGVKMDFTPVVNPDGTIRVKVSPEVSALDYSNAVTISGFTIPAISTRRAETEVELRDGQSFAISGLLDHRTTENLSKMPGIGDIPILGKLFNSKNISRSVVELVVIVRARVVDPTTVEPDVPSPKWVVPNMTDEKFDQQLHHERPRDVPEDSQPIPTQPKP